MRGDVSDRFLGESGEFVAVGQRRRPVQRVAVERVDAELRTATRTRLKQVLASVVRAPGFPDGFAVADDGQGIPQSEREEIFEHGYTTADGGTGLGLTIVSEIADAHDWDVSVAASESGGAQFEFTVSEA